MRRRLTNDLKRLFVELLGGEYDLLFGRFKNEAGNETKQKAWERVVTEMNRHMGDAYGKTVAQWMKVSPFFLKYILLFKGKDLLDMGGYQKTDKGEVPKNVNNSAHHWRGRTGKQCVDGN